MPLLSSLVAPEVIRDWGGFDGGSDHVYLSLVGGFVVCDVMVGGQGLLEIGDLVFLSLRR